MKSTSKNSSNKSQPVEPETLELEYLRRIFLGGLSYITTEENLRRYCEQYGEVLNTHITLHKDGKSRGFGFVTFSKSSDLERFQRNRPHIIDGKQVDSKRSVRRPELNESNVSVQKIFIGGLKDVHTEDILREYFSKYGKILSIKIITNKTTGMTRGFAYVEFNDYDVVDKIVYAGSHSIKNILVDVKKNIYKKLVEAKEQAQNKQSNGNNSNGVVPPPTWNGWASGGAPNQNWGPPPPWWNWGSGPQSQTGPSSAPTGPPPGWTWGRNGWEQISTSGPPANQENGNSSKNSWGNLGYGYNQEYAGGPDRNSSYSQNRTNPYGGGGNGGNSWNNNSSRSIKNY